MVKTFLILELGALAGCTIAALLGRGWWVFELCTHFRAQYAALLLLCATCFAFMNQMAWSAAAGLLGAVNLAVLLPAYGRLLIPGQGEDQQKLRALLINVNFRNSDYARTLTAIRKLNPDLVCIIEVNRAWKEQLLTLRDRYPHMQGMALRNGWGMWLMSRAPFERCQVVSYRKGSVGIPHITADLTVEGRPFSVMVTHPYAPVTRRYAALRNRQLASLRQLVVAQRRPILILGDFNCSPWSPYFGQLLRMAGLRDSREGFGLQPTWPAWNSFLQIPIDHCLTSTGVAVSNRRVGPDVGSDHLPVVVDFSIV